MNFDNGWLMGGRTVWIIAGIIMLIFLAIFILTVILLVQSDKPAKTENVADIDIQAFPVAGGGEQHVITVRAAEKTYEINITDTY